MFGMMIVEKVLIEVKDIYHAMLYSDRSFDVWLTVPTC